MKTVNSALTISEQFCEFIDLNDAELKLVTGGGDHNNHGKNSCGNKDHHKSCGNSDWGHKQGHKSCN